MGPTEICNMALARIGARRINDYADSSDTKLEAVQCRLFYPNVARELIRSHLWRFAKHRVQLSQSTVTPAFQWSYQYELPNDFLRRIDVWDGADIRDGHTFTSYELEGKYLLTDEETVYLRYVRWVEDVTKWDALFVAMVVLKLAGNLAMPLTQNEKVKLAIDNEWKSAMPKVRAMDREEGRQIGRDALRTWVDARFSDTA